jgi:hypothetical protein
MQASARTQELKESFAAILQGVVETGDAAQRMRPDLGLILNRNRIDECLQRLDTYAEELQRLDRDLGEITRITSNIEEHFSSIRHYSALFALGASVHEALYRDYQILRALREKMNLILVAIIAGGGVVLAALLAFM